MTETFTKADVIEITLTILSRADREEIERKFPDDPHVRGPAC